jgi:uncharacterized protein YyaL (SSP411 family)
VLGDEDGAIACEYFGVSERGNFQDPHHPDFGRRNVLSTWEPIERLAERHGLAPAALRARLESIRARLFAARERRARPGLDDKALTSWNGLALAAFAEAGRVLGQRRFVDIAAANGEFMRRELWRDGRLLHTWKDGVAKVDGMLEDYACAGLGLVELFKATGELEWLAWARELFEVVLARFRDDADGLFFETPHDGERLLVRQKAFFDAATPAGNSAAALLAFWLGRYFGEDAWLRIAGHVVASQREFMLRAASGFGTLWQVAELLLSRRQELAIVGPAALREPFERVAAEDFRPWLALALAERPGGLPLLEGRDPGARARAWLCEDMACLLPAETPEQLAAQLDNA